MPLESAGVWFEATNLPPSLLPESVWPGHRQPMRMPIPFAGLMIIDTAPDIRQVIIPPKLAIRSSAGQFVTTFAHLIAIPDQVPIRQDIVPPRLAVPAPRHQAVITFQHLIGPEGADQLVPHWQHIWPAPLPKASWPIHRLFASMLPAYDDGAVSEQKAAMRSDQGRPPQRLPLSTGRSADAIQWVQAFIDQTIDHVATYAPPTPRWPLVPAMPPANRTGDTDPFPFDLLGLEDWGGAVLGLAERPKRLALRSVPRDVSIFARGNDAPDWLVGWVAQPIRAMVLPASRLGSLDVPALPIAPSGQPEAQWWDIQQRPPRMFPVGRGRGHLVGTQLVTISSGWIVPGPYYVAAGQVSPAAGVVTGDVRAAGED